MNAPLLSGRIAIYARYSSDAQREASIDDQVRRCREHIERLGGRFDPDLVYADHAISGASLQRPAFEKMMAGVKARLRTIDAIVTEDISRISRDFADAASVFRDLQYHGVLLLGVADGINSADPSATLLFAIRGAMAQTYIADLRHKTLRGLEGRSLAGFATGGLAYGYTSRPKLDEARRVVGHEILIDAEQAAIVVRMFRAYLDGHSSTTIAAMLNDGSVPPPRAHTAHRRKGWVASTIREMLHNKRYAGHWTFKVREWRKLPGTNKRRPRLRPAADVMHHERPELRIIDQELWNDVQARLAAVRAHYTRDAAGNPKGRSTSNRPNSYLFSGLLRCGCCDSPMVIIGGSSVRYYRCGDYHKRRVCKNAVAVKEPVVRGCILATIREMIASPAAVAYVRERLAERLKTRTNRSAQEVSEHQGRLAQSQQRIDRLTDMIADGERSEAILQKLRALEAQARDEQSAIDALAREATAANVSLPSVEAMTERVFDLEARLAADPLRGREELKRFFKGGGLRLDPQPDGVFVARGEFLPLEVCLSPNGIRPSSGDPNSAVYTYGCGGRI